MGANTKMKIVNSVLLLIAAALCIQAMTNDADLAEMGGEDESAGLGRRGGGEILTSSGSFVLSANRAGNDEEELGEELGAELDELRRGGNDEEELGEEDEAELDELVPRRGWSFSCPEGKLLGARMFKVLKNGTKVPGGMCVPLPKLEDFKIGIFPFVKASLCSESGCKTCAGEKCGTSRSPWVTMNGAT